MSAEDHTDTDSPKLLRDKVADQLRAAILDGTLLPGRRITEVELIELTKSSRTSVREALRVLEAQRLVEPSVRGVQISLPSMSEARHIYEVRAVVESYAARLFCERALDDDIRDLRRGFEAIGRDSRSPVMTAFDEIFFTRCGNSAIKSVIEPLYARIFVLRNLASTSPARRAASKAEYYALLEALEDRNADRAAAAVVKHVEAARDFALNALMDHQDWRVEIKRR